MQEQSSPDIVLVSDDPTRSDHLSKILAPWFQIHDVRPEESGSLDLPAKSIFVICANLENAATLRSIRELLTVHDRPSIFVFRTFNSTAMARAKDVRATECFVLPLNELDFIGAVRKALANRVQESWKSLDALQMSALESCASAMDACFSQSRNGQELPLDAVQDASEKIAAAAGDTALQSWLGAIEHYHDYTYTHCMSVCYTAVAFAEAIGIKKGDLTHLTLGALLHDIGKSQVPIAILDKPSKLDADEWRVMQQHPEFSRQILGAEQQLDKDTVEMAVHHHEKLDGTGYPDGLKGAEISDVVRLTAIADVYSALVDKRSYKPGFPPEKALEIMATMSGALDQDFVKTFAEIVMSPGTPVRMAG